VALLDCSFVFLQFGFADSLSARCAVELFTQLFGSRNVTARDAFLFSVAHAPAGIQTHPLAARAIWLTPGFSDRQPLFCKTIVVLAAITTLVRWLGACNCALVERKIVVIAETRRRTAGAALTHVASAGGYGCI
jgi:hypothetical protein